MRMSYLHRARARSATPRSTKIRVEVAAEQRPWDHPRMHHLRLAEMPVKILPRLSFIDGNLDHGGGVSLRHHACLLGRLVVHILLNNGSSLGVTSSA